MTPAKRAMDVGLALILAVLLAPLIAVVAVVILVRDGWPVFFVSDRMRTPDRRFRLWKFRTMTRGRDDGDVTGGHKAARLTRTGRFLRRTRLDELPQLWNVLKGDLSFVGPRPPLPSVVARFPEIYAEVLQSRPGITGLATLYYHRHEERIMGACRSAEEAAAVYDRACVPRKARLDRIYRDRRSLALDLRLMAMTAARAVGRDLRSCGWGGRRS